MVYFSMSGVICFVTAQHDFTLVVLNAGVNNQFLFFLYH